MPLPILLLIIWMTSGCKKKVDFEYDNRPNPRAEAALNTRLVNLMGYRELKIGDKRLTSFLPPDNEGYYGGAGTMRVTPYFPQTGQLSTVYSFPSEFLNNDGYIHDVFLTSLSVKDAIGQAKSLDIKDYGRTPMDFYVVRYADSYSDSTFVIPRDITTSSNPENFKIRILNLSTDPDYFQRDGRMSLAFADGTPVSNSTSHVARGAYSDYIELPYGTYQFKVLTDDEREVPAKAAGTTESVSPILNIVNPNTGTLMAIGNGTPGVAGYSDSWLTYAPIKTFQPGGVYTVVVSNVTGYSEAIAGSNGETVGVICNSFQIINDVAEPLNNYYARVQAVNAQPGIDVKWQVDDIDIGSTAYTSHTAYQPFLTGKHIVKAFNGQGILLAEKEVSLLPGDNITAWLYLHKDGKPAITSSNNNLSGFFSESTNGNDGSYLPRRDAFVHWIRLMNFCPDIEDVTFTANNGQPLSGQPGASSNVLFGLQKIDNPYARMVYNFSTSILTYASGPNVVPGNWVQNIEPLPSRAFIKNINLYKTAEKPNAEPGIYTVALMGKLEGAAPGHAQLILIKHNP